jgi:hypothetical protein
MKLVREYIYEKFRDESDPIEDLGIGVKAMWNNLKKGDVLQLTKKLQLHANGSKGYVYPKGSFILITSQVSDEDNRQKHFVHSHINNFQDLKNEKVAPGNREGIGWFMGYNFFKEHFIVVNPKTLKESVNEKFSVDSDPIHDMGIGVEAQMKKKLKNMNVMEFIDFLDEIPKIRKKYRDESASYDDSWYTDIPIKELEKLGIKPYMLDIINDNTDDYNGWIEENAFDLINISGGN